MIIDKELLFSDAQATTISSANCTDVSTNTVDLGKGAGRNMNPRLRVFAQIVQVPAGLTSLKAVLKGCPTNSSTAADWKVIADGGAVALASLVKGTQLLKDVPYLVDEKYRFLRMEYVTAGTATTAAKVTAGLIADGVPAIELTH